MTYTGVNLEPLSAFYSDMNGAAASYASLDNTVLHDEHPSIRLGPDYVRGSREVDGAWLNVNPGDHIYYAVWLKTATFSSSNPYAGMRIGYDYYLSSSQGYGIAILDAEGHHVGRPSDADVVAGVCHIPWSTDWTLVIYDFYVPSDYYSYVWHDGLKACDPAQINSMTVWVDAWNVTDDAYCWFSDPVLYVNPSIEGGGGGKTMTLSSDNFNDNSLAAQWSTLINAGDSVAEVNGRIEATAVSANGVGVVSASSYDFTESDFQVDYDVHTTTNICPIHVGLTKVTGNNPYSEASWYRFFIDPYGAMIIQKSVGGSISTVYSVGSGIPSSGTVRIVISSGVINFYLNGSLVYSESYALSSYTAYLYIYSADNSSGTAYFDNFVNNNPPILGGELPISVVISYLMVMRNQ